MSDRVLVVEDEVLLALDLADQLTEAGFEVIGPAMSVAKALTLIAEVGCDVAVLDVNLGDETSERIAHVLRARRTPFVILTGYSAQQLQPGFQGAPVLSKPAPPSVLLATLRHYLAREV
jgi:DNA-binding response OmpR family regulator